MKKQIPILMSTMMVQAELAYRKIMTRRTTGFDKINKNPDNYQFSHFEENAKGGLNAVFQDIDDSVQQSLPLFESISCPYGKPEDILYVREEYYQLGHWEIDPGKKTKGGRTKWKFVPDSQDFSFDPPEDFRKGRHHKDSLTSAVHKRLGRFMPKKYARIWLEVTDIRVERLQDITEADTIAEGIDSFRPVPGDGPAQTMYRHYMKNKWGPSPVHSFQTLWERINGHESWEANPWVWVVSFKILSTAGKPAGLEKEEVG